MSKTSIEWTEASWNPVRGCSRVSRGCEHCYAERMAARFSGPGKPFEGFARHASFTHGAERGQRPPRWTGRVELIPSKLDEPLRWGKPRRVFVNSMSDLFHEALPDEAVDRVFAVMALAPQHTFQVLTKRPERMRAYVSALPDRDVAVSLAIERVLGEHGPCAVSTIEDLIGQGPLPNLWLGTSVEDQKTADERTPLLLQTPAAKRFVSYEPALGPVDLDGPDPYSERGWLRGWHAEPEHARGCDGSCRNCPEAVQVQNERLDWVIVGGESGPGARPCDVVWLRSVVRQCHEAGVACFVKQLGARPRSDADEDPWPRTGRGIFRLKSPKGGDPSEWSPDLRVREFPR